MCPCQRDANQMRKFSGAEACPPKPGRRRVWGCEGAEVPRCEGARVPGCQGAEVPGCEGARVPGCQGAEVPGCEGLPAEARVKAGAADDNRAGFSVVATSIARH